MTVTFETARRLKEAGFPQNTLHFYKGESGRLVLGCEHIPRLPPAVVTAEGWFDVAAPMLHEVLIAFGSEVGQFTIIYMDYGVEVGFREIDQTHYQSNEDCNAAEAAALLWLTINKLRGEEEG